MTLANLKEQCAEAVEAFTKKANELYSLNLNPNLSFKLKSSGTAGYAYYNKNLVKINPYFLEKHPEHIIKITTGHEIAHLVDYAVYKGRGHKHTWKSVMVKLGLEPIRCHPLGRIVIPGRNRYLFKCPACEKSVILSQTKYNNITRGSRYRHAGCGTKSSLEFVSII